MRMRQAAALLTAICVSLTVCLSDSGMDLRVSASLSSEKNELESKKDQIEAELDQIEADLQATKDNIAQEEQYQASLTQKIQLNQEKLSVLEQETSALSDELAEKEQQLTEKEAELSDKEAEIADTYETYKQRMRAMYMAGEMSALEMLFEADSFADFLTNIEIMKAVSAHDADLMDSLEQQKNDLKNAQAQLEQTKKDLEAQQAAIAVSQQEINATNQQLQADYQESKTATQDLEQERLNFEANKEQRLKEAEEIDNEIQKLLAQIAAENSQNQNQGGSGIITEQGFLWPLPGFSNVNSPYGWRWDNSDFHTGVDLGGSGVYGANIVAAKSGVVVSPMTHWSYGNNVVINHGDGYVTLYAHCSQVLVSPGQTVNQGDVIALVGATGNVTGPHLHFEVYYNGVRQDPAAFISYF